MVRFHDARPIIRRIRANRAARQNDNRKAENFCHRRFTIATCSSCHPEQREGSRFCGSQKTQIPRRFAPRNDNDFGNDKELFCNRAAYGAQSAMKIFVSCGALALRFEAHTSFLPSGLNMGNPSKPGL